MRGEQQLAHHRTIRFNFFKIFPIPDEICTRTCVSNLYICFPAIVMAIYLLNLVVKLEIPWRGSKKKSLT